MCVKTCVLHVSTMSCLVRLIIKTQLHSSTFGGVLSPEGVFCLLRINRGTAFSQSSDSSLGINSKNRLSGLQSKQYSYRIKSNPWNLWHFQHFPCTKFDFKKQLEILSSLWCQLSFRLSLEKCITSGFWIDYKRRKVISTFSWHVLRQWQFFFGEEHHKCTTLGGGGGGDSSKMANFQ